MKKIFFISFVIILTLVLSACFAPLKGENGRLIINMNSGSARASGEPYPPTDANGVLIDLVHNIQLEGPTGKQTHRLEKGVTSAFFMVAPGIWRITIDSYHGSDHYAAGTERINVKAGQDSSARIKMSHIHLWTATGVPTIAPTCTVTGIGTVLCTPCGESESNGVIPALGHLISWNPDYTNINDNSCSRSGCSHIAGLGDIGPGSGIIFYVDENGFPVEGHPSTNFGYGVGIGYTAHYLEAAPTDSGTAQWGGSGTQIAGDIITHEGPPTALPLNDYIGKGRRDTQIIIAHLGNNETNRAAQVAAAANFGSKNDWFLPSIGELRRLYLQWVALGNSSNFNLLESTYWSSSQLHENSAWMHHFYDPSNFFWNGRPKGQQHLVRAIRAF